MDFTLYTRSYCHLCSEMLDALNTYQHEYGPFTVEQIDVDQDEALVARFDELVPVLFGQMRDTELCHYFLDHNAVRSYLEARAALSNVA
jgi:hypothetical protein